jgi:hypothetical protein
MKLKLDSAALRRIFETHSLPLPPSGQVLFALRGALPARTSTGWSKSVELALVEPDFIHMRCTLGIWNLDTGKIFAAPGSTVPHRDNVLKAAARTGVMQGRGTNQLEPGFYTDLTKGEHLQGKPAGHAALRQTGFRFYRRARHAPPYTKRDPLYFGNPYDNLHCAWNKNPKSAGFRSAGCLVVAGWPHSPRLAEAEPNQGPWKTFHDFLYAGSQKSFPLLLLPAKDALGSLSSSQGPERLLYGSEGPAVEKLQHRLTAKGHYKGRITGKLGVSTYRAWNTAGFR